MDVYRTDRIRNVVLLGHGGSRERQRLWRPWHIFPELQTVSERLRDGNTISDFDKEEIKRKFSISASIVPIEWGRSEDQCAGHSGPV